MELFKVDNTYISIISIKLPIDSESFFIFIWKAYSRIFSLERALCFERKMKSEIRLNSENLFELDALEKNAIFFFWYWLNTTVYTGTVNTIQKELV